eukprot:3056822-Pleurochrysis_carterae.AAC.1
MSAGRQAAHAKGSANFHGSGGSITSQQYASDCRVQFVISARIRAGQCNVSTRALPLRFVVARRLATFWTVPVP